MDTDKRLEALEKKVAELEKWHQPSSIGKYANDLINEDEKEFKNRVRKILQLMEDEKVELAIYDDRELYFETRGKRSGKLIKVKFSDMIKAYMY